MQSFPPQSIDALCRRHCAFALYALPGQQAKFCMQTDGGITHGSRGEGFVLAEYDKEPGIILQELTAPPTPNAYALLKPPTPAAEETSRADYHQLFC
ncbi:MAG: hypothetical protein E7033_08455, partial [Akkermansiaceae bacterium]|nr:hypothetical protein [Akkermansiaceae bacterium]